MYTHTHTMENTSELLFDVVNPFGFTVQQWFVGYFVRFVAVSIFDYILEMVTKPSGLMPSRLAGMNSNFKPNNIDRACLLSNSFIEVVFVYNVLHVILKSTRYVSLSTPTNKHTHTITTSHSPQTHSRYERNQSYQYACR